MSVTISEPEFAQALCAALDTSVEARLVRSVTGPGRSGAVAAVYASHMLGIPFLPFGQHTANRSGTNWRRYRDRHGWADAAFYEVG